MLLVERFIHTKLMHQDSAAQDLVPDDPALTDGRLLSELSEPIIRNDPVSWAARNVYDRLVSLDASRNNVHLRGLQRRSKVIVAYAQQTPDACVEDDKDIEPSGQNLNQGEKCVQPDEAVAFVAAVVAIYHE